MGWLFMGKRGMGEHRTPTEYLDAQFTYDHEVDGQRKALRILASACVHNRIYYAAAEPSIGGITGQVFAIVCLVRWNPRSVDEAFGYKDMDENMGPSEATCPASILALLGPSDHPYALDWRRRCYRTLRRRSRPLDDGMRIRFPEPMTFTDGHVGQEFVVEKRGGTIRLKDADTGGRYRVSGLRDRRWSPVRRTMVHAVAFAPRP